MFKLWLDCLIVNLITGRMCTVLRHAVFSAPNRWRCAFQTMAHSWSLLLAFLFATLILSHSAEPGAPQGKRRQAQTSAAGTNTLQHPLQGLQAHRSSRDRGGHGGPGSRSAKAGAGLLSHRPVHPLARPEDDGTGLESLSPVRLEMGPGRDRDRVRMSMKSPSQGRENDLLGTRKGRGHGHGNGHGHHFEHRRQGSRHDKGRHGKGESTDPDIHDTDHLSNKLYTSAELSSAAEGRFPQKTCNSTALIVNAGSLSFSKNSCDSKLSPRLFENCTFL